MEDRYPCSSHESQRMVRLLYAQGTPEFDLILYAQVNMRLSIIHEENTRKINLFFRLSTSKWNEFKWLSSKPIINYTHTSAHSFGTAYYLIKN